MLNIVASFFRPTIPPSKDDVLQRKTRTKQECFSLHGNNFPLFFETIHRAAMAGCKPNRNTAQGNALGRKGIAILRSERAKGMGRIASELPPAALSERKLLSSLTPRVLPWAIYLLGLRPVITQKDNPNNIPTAPL